VELRAAPKGSPLFLVVKTHFGPSRETAGEGLFHESSPHPFHNLMIDSGAMSTGVATTSRFFVALLAIILIRFGSTRLMNRYPTKAKVLIAIYATATIAIALIISFLL
jgi:hypothetical protein